MAHGRYHYTKPKKGRGTSSDPGSAPAGTTEVGDYHTHGDYSRPVFFGLFSARTTADRDAYNSDHFSKDDMAENQASSTKNPEYRGYLGTPSGAFLKYDPTFKVNGKVVGQEGPLQ